MSIIPIRRFGDPVLRERARDVEEFDDALRRLADDMLETMYDAPGVGLAANQIGRAIRFFVADDGTGPRAMANPVLSGWAGEQIADEGCLSVPGLYYETPRAMRVRADGLDVYGKPLTIEGDELMARILQHEVDHLNGKLFLERVGREDRARALAAIRDAELGVPGPALRSSRPRRGR